MVPAMPRVPIDPVNPSFDQSVKVSFRRWARATDTERKEWERRRTLAWDRKRAEIDPRFAKLQQPPAADPWDPYGLHPSVARPQPLRIKKGLLGWMEDLTAFVYMALLLIVGLPLLGLTAWCLWAAVFH